VVHYTQESLVIETVRLVFRTGHSFPEKCFVPIRKGSGEKHSSGFLVNKQLDAQFFMYVYFYSLHVSGSHVPIIMRITVSMRRLVYVNLCR